MPFQNTHRLRLIGQVITVSLDTMEIVNALPLFIIDTGTTASDS